MIQENKRQPKIVVIGGGTGAFGVLTGLKNYPVDLTAVISMADDGGSTGVLREEFGILPPGDIRRALVAMSHSDNQLMAELFNYRFGQGGLKDHNFGNIMLTALERMTGNFEMAVERAGHVLGVKGSILPVTLDNVRLAAELEDGSVVNGESNIDVPRHDGSKKIKKVFLKPEGKINPRAKKAVLEADLIVFGPGDLYTSVVPNLLIKGMREAVSRSKATKVYIINIMTKWGETNGFAADNFINTIEMYLGKSKLDYAILNTKKPSIARLKKYEKEGAEFVETKAIMKKPTLIMGNFLRSSGFVRHDPDSLAKTIISLI
ncbi:MAG: YvcK family protein [bacterium]|nr:YvcK family protein [bacterium]